MSLPSTMIRQEFRRASGASEDCKRRLRQLNESKLTRRASELGISYQWMLKRLHLSGMGNILDLWEEHLYRSVDSWVAWELNPQRWEEEFNREFLKR